MIAKMPVSTIAGEMTQLIDIDEQWCGLHAASQIRPISIVIFKAFAEAP
jgi:hypothetical protein